MLAGSVTADLVGSALYLTGDAADNDILVSDDRGSGRITIQGRDTDLISGGRTSSTLTFTGLTHILVAMGAGDDSFQASRLDFGATSLTAGISVDGGEGDDKIRLDDTSVGTGFSSSISIFGDYKVSKGGDDQIQVSNTTIRMGPDSGTVRSGLIQIMGDNLAGGDTLTGGDDQIQVSNTTIQTDGTGSYYATSALDIWGDYAGPTRVIGTGSGDSGARDNAQSAGGSASIRITGGNDTIDVTDTTINDSGSRNTYAYVQIFGDDALLDQALATANASAYDYSSPSATASASATGGEAHLSIIGGDDTIHLTNITINAQNGVTNGMAYVQVYGDLVDHASARADSSAVSTAFSQGPLPAANASASSTASGGTVQATILGGDDDIRVTNTTINASGGYLSSAYVQIYGDFTNLSTSSEAGADTDAYAFAYDRTSPPDSASANAAGTATSDASGGKVEVVVIGGDDRIRITNTTISAGGDTSNARSLIVIYGDDVTAHADADAIAGAYAFAYSTAYAFGSPSQTATANSVADSSTSAQGGSVTLTVRGGNDDIDVTNTTISSGGPRSGVSYVEIYGDSLKIYGSARATADSYTYAGATASSTGYWHWSYHNNRSASPTDGGFQAHVVGGDDTIRLANTTLTGSGDLDGAAYLDIYGDDIRIGYGSPSVSVAGGNDRISILNSRVQGSSSGEAADVAIYGDYLVSAPGAVGSITDSADQLKIQGSVFDHLFADLGAGDDSVVLHGNSYLSAHLDGGDGTDSLNSTDRAGTLVTVGFEKVKKKN